MHEGVYFFHGAT